MNLDRLRWGEWIAAIAALDLLVVTFRAWYKVTGTGAHVTAWDALDNGRYLLIATAIVGIFLWLIKAAEDTQQLSFEPGWIAAGVGLICTVYVAYRLASPPSDALEADLGIYLGLISALGVTIGGLLSARQAAPAREEAPGGLAAAAAGPRGGATGPLTPDTSATWSPAAPAPSTTGWSPATPAVAVPPATAAGAALGGGGERPLRSGDHVVLTASGARFPAGTLAQVVEVLRGGALVEVKAADGMAERFEVPEQAYELAPAGGVGQPPAGGENWSPAMPAAAGDDWGFDEQPANGAAAPEARATATGVDEPPADKVPWWKREIGGGKKKKGEEALALGGAAAAGAAAAHLADRNGSSEEKPSFFKRVFGGGKNAEPETEALDTPSGAPVVDEAPAGEVAGIGEAAESDTGAAEPPTESVVDDAPTEPEAANPEVADASPAAAAPGGASEAATGATPSAATDASEAATVVTPSGAAAASEPDVELDSATPSPAPAADPEAAPASESAEVAPSSESVEAAPASDPGPAASDEGVSEPGASESSAADAGGSQPAGSEASASEQGLSEDGPGVGGAGVAAGAGAAAAAAASAGEAGADETAEQPMRKRSNGSRKVPNEAIAAAGVDDDPPKVGDEVQLTVGGGKFDAGTRGTVVDVFSAGVIVELDSAEGRTERVDLPFEAIAPANT